MRTIDLLLKLLNNRKPPVRLTRKQFNWLSSVARDEASEKAIDAPFDVIINAPSIGAQRAGYGDVATIFEVELYGTKTYFKREFNGSGLVYQ